jgi:murein DD-endopeptidase MepM/ murein hydrolase activator NlpD
LPPVQQVQNLKTEEYVRDNISSMAVKLGEMQAQVMRLDSLGERISKLVGVGAPKNEGNGKDGQGGPLIHLSRPLSASELQGEIDRLAEIVEQRSDALTALESQLMERRVKTVMLPTITPINANHIGSTFGRRVDPIVGVSAMHEGVDFVADSGTPVIASAGGVVLTAEYHPQYGKMIEVDHGNDFSSVYAHLSKIGVKAGQIVKRGQFIGASGNTGRSTGPHLHFEVRFKGVAQNPDRFLQMGSRVALISAGESKIGLLSEKTATSPKKSRATASFSHSR